MCKYLYVKLFFSVVFVMIIMVFFEGKVFFGVFGFLMVLNGYSFYLLLEGVDVFVVVFLLKMMMGCFMGMVFLFGVMSICLKVSILSMMGVVII